MMSYLGTSRAKPLWLWQMTYWAVIAAQVAGGWTIWRLVGSGLVGLEALCSGCMFYDASGSCQGKYQTMEWGATTQGVTPESHYNVNSLSYLSPPSSSASFFHLLTPKQHPHNAVLLGLQQAQWLVLIEIIVWYEAEPPLHLFSYSYHGVTGWRTDSIEILQGAARWNCILAHCRGCYPQRTSKLLDTVCCVLSTATVIVKQCLVWCGGPLRIALW